MKTTQKSLAWLAVVLALLATGMAFTVWSYRQIEQASNLRRDSRTIITAADRLLSALTEAETAQRGYALTGDESYLQPYLAVRGSMQFQLEALRRMGSNPMAQQHTDALAPLVTAKMQEMERTIALRTGRDVTAALSLINSDEGKRLMEGIRREMGRFVQIETDIQAQHNAQFDAGLRRLFASIVGVGVLAVLFALYFAYASYRAAQQRLKNLVHQETRHLLEAQTATNADLQQTNRTLQASEQKLTVTLNSIGDAVIATDAAACVTLLNPVAEGLTGWTSAQAQGRPIDEVFHILAKATRARATIPVASVLAHGTVQGMANHTVLVARDGSEFDIADSCAPIRDAGGLVIGAVLVFRNVTDEYQAQQALRDSAARVQAILNTVGDGIVTMLAATGVMESVNPAIERMFGYEADELKGKGFGFVVPELDQNHGNVSLAHYEASSDARSQGVGREVMGFRKDGSVFPLEITVGEVLLGGERYFTGILRDISARKQVEEALIKANALQSAIFNSANFSSIATDTRGVIQIFNVGAEHMLGYTAAEVMNTVTPADLSDPIELVARAQALTQELQTEITPGFDALVFKASRGIEDNYELTYIHKDGTRLPAMVSVTALRDATSTIIGYLLIGTDNSVRKRLDAERTLLETDLQIKNGELEAARSVADKANLAKSEFLSNMSHELRSPLNAILGFAQLLETSVPPPTAIQKSSVEQILKAGWYLLELINEVLDLALIESGRLSMSMEPVSLPEVLLDCRTMIEPLAGRRGIEMHFPSFSGPCFVDADRTRVKQVFVNLLSNAIKYNRRNGAVEVTCQAEGEDRLHIVVRDTGEGLSESELAQLFQPFNRLGQEDSDEEGTGIGLVVSKRLVELMGGSIGAHSTVGVGSEFWIDLHVADPHSLALDDPTVPVCLPATVPGGQKVRTLLYVEDNLANMELVAQLIARRPDMRLLRAQDGTRGVALARASLPDVILMDINLPGVSGWQALVLLHDDPLTRHIPVLALSANAMPRDVEKGLQAGFFRYLTKPIKLGEFMEALDLALRFAETASVEMNFDKSDA